MIGRVPNVNFVGVVVNGLPLAEAAAYGAGYGYGYKGGEQAPVQRAESRSTTPEDARA